MNGGGGSGTAIARRATSPPRDHLRPPDPARRRRHVRGRVAFHRDLGARRARARSAPCAARDGNPLGRRAADRGCGPALDAHARELRRARRGRRRHLRPDRPPGRPALAARPADRERALPPAACAGPPRRDARPGVGPRHRRRGRRARRRCTRPGAPADDSVGLGARPAPAPDGARRAGSRARARGAAAPAAPVRRSSTDPACAVAAPAAARPSPPDAALVARWDRRRPRASRRLPRVASRSRPRPFVQPLPAYTPRPLLAAGRPSRAAPQTVHLQSGSRRSWPPG